jgi:phospholipase/lecithinase/hemolysin
MKPSITCAEQSGGFSSGGAAAHRPPVSLRPMRSRLRHASRFVLATLTLGALAACSDSGTVEPATPALFSTTVVFGASLDDTGNACNLSAAACTPAPYATPRVSNGTLWVELVAQRFGATVTPSRTGGTNFAYSGARTGPIAGTTQGVPNMVQQVDAYLASTFTANRAQTLFVIDAATVGNDINDALVQGLTNPAAPLAIVTGAVGNVVSMINKLYAGGARNILLVNSTDIGRTPLVRGLGAVASATASALSTQFNSGIALQLPSIRTASAGLTITLLDLGALTTEVLATPSAFGFTNVAAPCVVTTPPASVCTTPDSFFFWDGFHPTAATGRLVAARAITALGR